PNSVNFLFLAGSAVQFLSASGIWRHPRRGRPGFLSANDHGRRAAAFGNKDRSPRRPQMDFRKPRLAILEDLVVIAITLDDDDDAQVIFETLYGHGVELTATDLNRNYVFLLARQKESDAERLYRDQWRRYESGGWKQEERR